MHHRRRDRKHLEANIIVHIVGWRHPLGNRHSMPPPRELRPTEKSTPVQMKQEGRNSGRKEKEVMSGKKKTAMH